MEVTGNCIAVPGRGMASSGQGSKLKVSGGSGPDTGGAYPPAEQGAKQGNLKAKKGGSVLFSEGQRAWKKNSWSDDTSLSEV